MNESLAAVRILLAATAAACSSSDARQSPLTSAGQISGLDGEWLAGAEIRVAYGRRWPLQGDFAVTASGEFLVPASAGVVVAYVDANRNGRLDRFSEASADCQYVRSIWRCEIGARKTTVHRAIVVAKDTSTDQTLLFWEDYGVGARQTQSSLCIDRGCTESVPNPFLTAAADKVNALIVCGAEGFAAQAAEIRRMEKRGSDASVRIAHPPSVAISVSMTSRVAKPSDKALLEIDGVLDSDRVLVWAGHAQYESKNLGKLSWTSEDSDISVKSKGNRVEVSIPIARLNECRGDDGCQMIVQIVRHWAPLDGQMISATEFRTTVDF